MREQDAAAMSKIIEDVLEFIDRIAGCSADLNGWQLDADELARRLREHANRQQILLIGIRQDAQTTIDRCDALLGLPRASDLAEVTTNPMDRPEFPRHQCEGGLELLLAPHGWIVDACKDASPIKFCPSCGKRLPLE